MNHRISFDMALTRLQEQCIACETLEIGAGRSLLLTEHGGRALGPFEAGGESVFWMNEAFENREKFAEFIKAGHWNMGGERFWLNPELSFFCDSPQTFDATYSVPPEIDPGRYLIAREVGCVTLKQGICVRSRWGVPEERRCDVTRTYAPAREGGTR